MNKWTKRLNMQKQLQAFFTWHLHTRVVVLKMGQCSTGSHAVYAHVAMHMHISISDNTGKIILNKMQLSQVKP